MNVKRLQERASTWNTEFKAKRKRTPEATIVHMTEELGEVAGCIRDRDIGQRLKKDEIGLSHPEGLGSELADMVILACILADMHGVELQDSVELKMAYNEARNADRLARKTKGKK